MRSRKRRAKVTQTPKQGHASDDVGRPSDAPLPIRPGESRCRVALSANRCPLPNLATAHPRVRSVGPVFCATIASAVRRRAPSGSARGRLSGGQRRPTCCSLPCQPHGRRCGTCVQPAPGGWKGEPLVALWNDQDKVMVSVVETRDIQMLRDGPFRMQTLTAPPIERAPPAARLRRRPFRPLRRRRDALPR